MSKLESPMHDDLPGDTYVLFLNDMRSSKIEYRSPVARAKSRAALEALVARERTEPYRDDRWSKSFRKNGMLEWYNGAYVDIVNITAKARAEYDELPFIM